MTKLHFRLQTLALLGILGLASGCNAQIPAAKTTGTNLPGAGFVLQDTLNRAWRGELVTFPLSPADLKAAQAGQTLAAPDKSIVPYQIVGENGQQKIAFMADLDPLETRAYHFTNATEKAATDLKVEETAAEIRISNGQTGVAVRKKLDAGQGPIAGVMLNSGVWVGDSTVSDKAGLTDYSASVVARGPAFSEVSCQAKGEKGNWQMSFRLPTNAPVVVVNENFDLKSDAKWTLDLSKNFAPDHVFYRFGKGMGALGPVGTMDNWKIAPDAEPAFVLEPWLHWWARQRQGNWFGLSKEGGNEMLTVAALNPGIWVDPKLKNLGSEQLSVKQSDAGLTMDLPLKAGGRRWLLAALPVDKSLAAMGELSELLKDPNKAGTLRAPLPQKLLIKYGDFPLDMVKDQMVFAGAEKTIEHPRLFVTKAQLPELKKGFVADEALLKKYRAAPLYVYAMDDPIAYYLKSGDEELGQHLAQATTTEMQRVIDLYLDENNHVTLGFAPHNDTGVLTLMNLCDAIMDTPAVSPELRTRMQNQIAFLAQTVNRDDFWSPERGYSANPNMTTNVAAYQTITASMIPQHPLSKSWIAKGLEELKENQLDNWSDDKGGWLEAPHYAMVSYDYMLGSFEAVKNAGGPDYVHDPRMKNVALWFAQIDTPRDVNLKGWRHHPPIGNTYINEPTGEYGMVAALWKDKDPQFAAQMKWMHEQEGAPATPGVGGFFPTMAGYRTILGDAVIAPKAPNFTSTMFPKTGLVLRNQHPSDRESYLHMIQGDNHAHYDKDSGSVVIWGKGRVIADDFGYEGYMPGDDHNMVTSTIAQDTGIMHVSEFAPAPNLDYVRGEKQAWTRQIALVKGDAATAPEYYVLRDSMQIPAPATWRMWFVANAVTPGANGALVVGKDDVDTDVYFAAPNAPKLTTEEKTRQTYGLDSEGKYGIAKPTRTGLIADADGQGDAPAFATVIFPRLKTEKAPTFTSLAEGKVIQVQSGDTTDYVFLSNEPFTFKQGTISFEGTAGLLRLRGDKATLTLGAGGKLSARGQSIEKKATAPVRVAAANLIENGDFETTEQSQFVAPPESNFEVKVHAGEPAPTAGEHKGKQVLAIQLKDKSAYVGYNTPILLDNRRVYRVAMRVYTSDAIYMQAGGYASDGKDANLKDSKGQVWQYNLIGKGPTEGWQTLETTIGPVGSDAKYQFPPATLQTGVGLWISGGPGTLYVDDVTVEEVKANETP